MNDWTYSIIYSAMDMNMKNMAKETGKKKKLGDKGAKGEKRMRWSKVETLQKNT